MYIPLLLAVLQGWRLDVPALPRLAEVAAWRGTPPSNNSNNHDQQQHQQQQQEEHEQQPDPQQQQAPAAAPADSSKGVLGRTAPSAAMYHGGCYSPADVAAIVAYAAERCIEVVPEIELPGHCCAALAAYPNLSCESGTSQTVPRVSMHGRALTALVHGWQLFDACLLACFLLVMPQRVM